MPSRIKVKVVAARDLPVMDQASNLTDAYVELKLSDIFAEKTDIAPQTLNPSWNKDFRIEVPHDGTVLKHPLEFRVWDRDQFSKDDIIGIVYFDLNNLFLKDAMEVSGWFPIFDTFRGIRGELKVAIKLEFFGELNSGLDLSNNVMFFSSKTVFPYLKLKDIQGFVEELIVDDDPEYHWKDTFRTSRSSNEARQYLLYKLSGKLRRQIGNKVRELGGNAVLGFQKHFDFAETCIVARGYGTACTVKHTHSKKAILDSSDSVGIELPGPAVEVQLVEPSPIPVRVADKTLTPDTPNIPPKKDISVLKLHTDIQFLTMQSFPPPILLRMVGVVTARSVKLIPKGRSEDQQRGIRDTWWAEIREELRAHARYLNCQFVIGYTESTTIRGDTMVLTSTGTAANIKLPTSKQHEAASKDKSASKFINGRQKPCSFCHIPYASQDAPFKMNLAHCQVCGKKVVPEVLLATVDPPPGIPIIGRGQLIEARVCRSKKKATGEANAVIVSEGVPFLEYDLHKQLIYKLRLLGMNAIFSLSTQLSVGDNIIVLYAQGTAVCLEALPRPEVLTINTKSQESLPLYAKLRELSVKNAKALGKQDSAPYAYMHQYEALRKSDADQMSHGIASTSDAMTTFLSSIQLHAEIDSKAGAANVDSPLDSKPTYVVELDDKLDEHFITLLMDPPPPKEMHLCNTEVLPGSKLSATSDVQLMSLIRCLDWPETREQRVLDQFFNDSLTSLYNSILFKIRGVRPAAVCGIRIGLQLGEFDELQLLFTGMVQLPSDLKASKETITSPRAGEKKKRKKQARTDDEATTEDEQTTVVKKKKGGDDEKPPSPRSPEKPERKAKQDKTDKSDEEEDRAKTKSSRAIQINTAAAWRTNTVGGDDEPALSPASLESISPKSPRTRREGEATDEERDPGSAGSAKEKPRKKSKTEAESPEEDAKRSHLAKQKKKPKDEEDLLDIDENASLKGERTRKKMKNSGVFKEEAEDLVIIEDSSPTDSVKGPGKRRKSIASDEEFDDDEDDEQDKKSRKPKRRRAKKKIEEKNNKSRFSKEETDFSSSSDSEDSDDSAHRFSTSFSSLPSENLSTTSATTTPAKKKGQLKTLADVELTPLSYIPGTRVEKLVGRVNLHFVKESFTIREQGGMSVFIHHALLEAQKIARAHVLNMGGNCLAAYHIDHCIITEKPNKNQGYILININGDAILVEDLGDQHRGKERIARLSLKTGQ